MEEGKLMKKLLFSFIVLIMLVPQVVSAENFVAEETNSPTEIKGLGESIKVKGELSPVETKMNNNLIQPNSYCIACFNTNYKVSVISGPTKVKRFVRYLTGSWAKASSYTWSKTNSASSTISNDVGLNAKGISSKLGVSKTVSTQYSVSIKIPANSSKFSKLAFYSDYNKRHVRVKKYSDDYLLSNKTGYHYAPRVDTYLQVVYK